MEDECHALDVQHSLEIQGGMSGSTFQSFVSALRRQSELRDAIDSVAAEIGGLEQLLTLAVVSQIASTSTVLTQLLADEISTRRNKKKEMVQTRLIIKI